MAANLALQEPNNVLVCTLGGGDAQPATIDWTVGNAEILRVAPMSGQPEFQVQVEPIGPGVATVTATLLDVDGNQLQQVAVNVAIGAGDPQTASVAITGNAQTPAQAYATGGADPNAPGAGHVTTSSAGAPVAAANANAAGAPAPVLNGDDAHGTVTFGSNGAPAAGAQVDVTFHAPYNAAPAVVLVAANDATQPLGLEVVNVTANGFSIATHVAPAAAQGAAVYAVDYEVMG